MTVTETELRDLERDRPGVLLVDVVRETAPDFYIPCWVGVDRDLGQGWTQRGDPELCVDKIAEWWTACATDSLRIWLPTCTGCKDRFLRLNPFTLSRPMR